MATDTKRLILRIPGEISEQIELFRDRHEASSSEGKLSLNIALVTLIKRGLVVSPEMRMKLAEEKIGLAFIVSEWEMEI